MGPRYEAPESDVKKILAVLSSHALNALQRGASILRVAEGCVADNDSEVSDVVNLAKALNAAGLRTVVTFYLIPELGCGTLYAVVGPRGGLYDLVFVGDKGYARVNRPILGHFTPKKLIRKDLFYRALQKFDLDKFVVEVE